MIEFEDGMSALSFSSKIRFIQGSSSDDSKTDESEENEKEQKEKKPN